MEEGVDTRVVGLVVGGGGDNQKVFGLCRKEYWVSIEILSAFISFLWNVNFQENPTVIRHIVRVIKTNKNSFFLLCLKCAREPVE